MPSWNSQLVTPAGPGLKQDPEPLPRTGSGLGGSLLFREERAARKHTHSHICVHTGTHANTRTVTHVCTQPHTGFVGSPALAPGSAPSLHTETCAENTWSTACLLNINSPEHFTHVPWPSIFPGVPAAGGGSQSWGPFLPQQVYRCCCQDTAFSSEDQQCPATPTPAASPGQLQTSPLLE